MLKMTRNALGNLVLTVLNGEFTFGCSQELQSEVEKAFRDDLEEDGFLDQTSRIWNELARFLAGRGWSALPANRADPIAPSDWEWISDLVHGLSYALDEGYDMHKRLEYRYSGAGFQDIKYLVVFSIEKQLTFKPSV